MPPAAIARSRRRPMRTTAAHRCRRTGRVDDLRVSPASADPEVNPGDPRLDPPPSIRSHRRRRPIRSRAPPADPIGTAAGRPAGARAARRTRSHRRADPLAAPGIIPQGTPAGQNPTPFAGTAAVPAADLQPGQRVDGRCRQADLHQLRSADRQPADGPGRCAHFVGAAGARPFYWVSDTQLRWRPQDFWPANTVVNIDAAGAKSTFRTGESLGRDGRRQDPPDGDRAQREAGEDVPGVDGQARGTRDQERHLLRAGEVRRHRDGLRDLRRAGHLGAGLQAQSAGRGPHRQQRHLRAQRAVVGRPIRARRNVSHGCINLSPANAQWFYDNFGSGDPVVIKNSVGTYNQPDGASGLADVLSPSRYEKRPHANACGVGRLSWDQLQMRTRCCGSRYSSSFSVDIEGVVERVDIADHAVAPELRR